MVKMGSAVGVALAGFPLRQLLSLRLVSQRLKVSLETVFRLQTCAHSVTAHFHQPGGVANNSLTRWNGHHVGVDDAELVAHRRLNLLAQPVAILHLHVGVDCNH